MNRVTKLEKQIKNLTTDLQAAKARLAHLSDKLMRAIDDASADDPTQTPAQGIYLDVITNQGRHPNGRRYSIDTLVWAQQLHAISPSALDHVRAVFPLPGESLINARFAQNRRAVSAALQDMARVSEVIALWMQTVPPEIPGREIVLAVDAVAFRPLVTITENGEIEGLKHLKRLDDKNLFEHFVLDPISFAQFLAEHWKDAYSALFAFHIQPLNPKLPCSVVHVYAAEHGKGGPETVETLMRLKSILEGQFGFQVVGLAFDGDSCFNSLHCGFRDRWKQLLKQSPTRVPTWRFRDTVLVICDPLHLLKRIRYRLLKISKVISGKSRIDFCIDRIKAGRFLSPIVFDNSQETKMHDSLPLELFSAKTLAYILHECLAGEGMMIPWCLLVIALTMPDLSTETRTQTVEIGFWMLYLYADPMTAVEGDENRPPWLPFLPRQATIQTECLFTHDQIRDGLNTFLSLLIVLSNSEQPFCLNRIGSNPLEHAFGSGRIRCHDVHTMERLIGTFAGQLAAGAARRVLEILATPRRRCSVGVDCLPLDRKQASVFKAPALEIARSLLARSATPAVPTDLLHPGSLEDAAWNELWRLPGLSVLQQVDGTPEPSVKSGKTKLSSNQVFLGLTKTPRAASLIQSPTSLGRMLDPELKQVRRALEQLYGMELSARDIEIHVHAIAQRCQIGAPTERRLEANLTWVRQHWDDVVRVFREGPGERRAQSDQ
jgi:hypothetical protein